MRRRNPARAGRQEYRFQEVRELRDGEPYYTGKNVWTEYPPYLTEGHFDLAAVKEAVAIASQAKRDGVPLGRGNFGETFRVDTSRGPVVVKVAASVMLYGERRAWTPEEQRRNIMHEAGVANELSEMGYRIVPETVYVELDDGTPALVREYGEPAVLTPEDFYALEVALVTLENETSWRVQDDLLVLRRADGSLFIGDVGIWQPPTIRARKIGSGYSDLDTLLSKLAMQTFGFDVPVLPRILRYVQYLQDRDEDAFFTKAYSDDLREALAERERVGLPSPARVYEVL